jgi:hypothetical protein
MPSARILYLAIKDNDDERTGSEQPGRRSVSPSRPFWNCLKPRKRPNESSLSLKVHIRAQGSYYNQLVREAR